MWRFAAQFGPLNTELHPNRVPSGTADDVLNVVLDGNTLKGRKGFDVHSTTTGYSFLNLVVASFANGDVYLVGKATDGVLYYKRLYVTPGSWTAITDKYTGHNTSDRGWFYLWADRLYYFDRVGGTKWHPSAGTWKAGIDSTVGTTCAAAGGGRKEGYYHVHLAKRNSVTRELSRVTDSQTTACLTRISAPSSPTGGIVISNWATIKAADLDYEWDQAWVYCTLNTEYIGLGAGAVRHTMKAYLDAVIAITAGSVGLSKSDSELDPSEYIRNTGGVPPPSRFGAFNGSRAVYLDPYDGAGSALTGRMMMSVPRFPTMVPQDHAYTYANKTFPPEPWNGVMATSFSGSVMGCLPIGERFIVFTETETHWLMPLGDGRLYPTRGHGRFGAVSEKAVIPVHDAGYALAVNQLLRVTAEGITNIAQFKFTPTLEAITATELPKCVMGHYGFRNEVWLAVPDGSDDIQRILIYDESRKQLMTIFEPVGLAVGEDITAMVEVALPNAEPYMLLATKNSANGRILKYPGAVYTDITTSDKYDCLWQGHFAQEFRAAEQQLSRMELHMGDNSANGITVTVAGLRTAAEETAGVAEGVIRSNTPDGSGYVFAKRMMATELSPNRDGNLFRIKITSTNSGDTPQTPEWSLEDMILSLDRTD